MAALWVSEAAAGGGAATDAYEDIDDLPLELHGMVDLYAQGSFFAHLRQARLRAFDPTVGIPSLGMARLTLAHKPETLGFRIDAGVGDIPNGYMQLDPALAAHRDVARAFSYVEQAFVTAVVPVGRGLSIDAGKFGTPIGLEDNEALASWNYSRSLLYLLAEPSYHAGARLTYPVTEDLAFSLFWVNGWDANVLSGNGMRAGAAAVSWSPTPKLELVVDWMGGLERAPTRLFDPTLRFRSELDGYVRFAATDRVSIAGTFDYGRDAADGGASWWGVGGYVHAKVWGPVGVSLRGEHYSDTDGFTSGLRQELEEATATLELRSKIEVVEWVARLEYRRDQSSAFFFDDGRGGRSPHQDTLGVSLVASF